MTHLSEQAETGGCGATLQKDSGCKNLDSAADVSRFIVGTNRAEYPASAGKIGRELHELAAHPHGSDD